jgi:hypothetical protein
MATEVTGTETIPQMRERIEAQNKELASLRKSNSELGVEVRKMQARDAFRSAGFKAVHGDLYAAQYPEGEMSADSIAAFAKEYGLAAEEAQAAAEPQEEEAETGAKTGAALSGMSRSGSRPGDGGQPAAGADKTMTRQEWVELSKSDPVAARKAVREGRVQIRKDNPFAARR